MAVENLYAKFSEALEIIVNSDAPIFERVYDAFQFNLADLDADALPDEIRQQFLILRERLRIDDANYDLDDAMNMACEIVDMADVVRVTQYDLKNNKERRQGISDRRKNCEKIIEDRRNGITDRRLKEIYNSYAI